MIKKLSFSSALLFLLAAYFCLLFSCEMGTSSASGGQSSDDSPPHWTILVYMAADNELESSAIYDINEMENADLPENLDVLVLFDRSAKYDSSNGDWSGTRLYKIKKDENVNKNLIASEILDCDELGISSESDCELDMGNKSSLSGFLTFAKREFPSEKYGLIIWGHGAGYAGFSKDETNNSKLLLPDIRAGIEEAFPDGKEKLEFIGFDTCYGATLEVAFELKDCAKIMAGTPGIVSNDGWNYKLLFSNFAETEMLAEDFADSCLKQFENSYADYQYGAFCALDLSKIENFVSAFDDFSAGAASKITSSAVRNKIFSSLESNSVSYLSSFSETDFYIDVFSLEKNISEILQDDEISSLGEKMEEALDSAVLSHWNKLDGKSLSVFMGEYKSIGIFSLSHPDLYVNGSRNSEICKFVSFCSNYVPTINQKGSLLDKLFYMTGD